MKRFRMKISQNW